MNKIVTWQKLSQTRVYNVMDRALTASHPLLEKLFSAMRYASLGGGKGIRAMLTFATGLYLAVPEVELDLYAAAIELIHSFSLVHDDLPAMDNDDLRRGKPSCHVAFGEATAILAGDALLTEAFSVLSETMTPHFNSLKRLKMVHTLAQAMGAHGMAGGQFLDIETEGKTLNFETLCLLHRLKTGALIEASVKLPLIYAEAESSVTSALLTFAQHFGLLFQIQDDLLDETGSLERLGKTPGKDKQAAKPSFVRVLGHAGAEAFLATQIQASREALQALPGCVDQLTSLLDFVVHREY